MGKGSRRRIDSEEISNRLISGRILSFIWDNSFRVICAYLIFGVMGCFLLQFLGQGMEAIAAEWPGNLLGNLGWGLLLFIGEHLIMLLAICVELPAAIITHLLFSRG